MEGPSFSVLATSDEALGERQAKALHTHLSLKKNGGGYCEMTPLSATEFRISYAKRAVQEQVLARREHQVKSDGQIFRVVVRKDEEPLTGTTPRPLETRPQRKKDPPVLPKPKWALPESIPQPLESIPQPLESIPQPLESIPQPLESIPQPLESIPQPLKATPPKQVEEFNVDPDPDSAHSLKALSLDPDRKKLEAYPFAIDLRFHRHLQRNTRTFFRLQQRLGSLACHFTPLPNEDEGQILVIRFAGASTIPLEEWKRLVDRVLAEFTMKYLSGKNRSMDENMSDDSLSGPPTFASMANDEPFQTASPLLSSSFKTCSSLMSTLNLTTSNCHFQSPMKYLMVQESFEKECKSQFPNLEFAFTEKQLHLKGTSAEVRWAREKLQERLTEVREHLVDLSETRRQFLRSCPPEEFSEMLFGHMLGKVTLEVNNEVSLYAISPNPDLLNEAENLLLDVVQEEVMDIDEADRPATLTPGWTELLSSARIEADKRVKVCSDATPSHGCSRVSLVGFREQVHQVKETLLKYLREKGIVQEEVKLKTVQFAENFEDILKILNIENLRADAKVQLSPTPSVLLKETRDSIAQSKAVLEKAQECLIHEVLTLSKVGAYKYFKEAGRDGLPLIGRNSNCFIKWQDDPSGTEASVGAQVRLPERTMVADTWCTFQLQGGFELFVCRGDITRQWVDTIVNAANEDLKHNGGVAAAISRAGGPTIQKESSDWVQRHGKVLMGQTAVTSAGKLPCKKVIHAVGPTTHRRSMEQQNEGYLKSAIIRSLDLAERDKFSSIAIPCVGSGISGVPIVLCAEWIVDAIKSFTETYVQTNHSLQEVILIDMREEVVRALQSACSKVWGGLVHALPGSTSAGDAAGGPATTPSALKVTFQSGTLEDHRADVLLVPVYCKDSALTNMRVGEALLKKAGGAFNALYTSQTQGKKFAAGDLVEVDVVAGGFPLSCSLVLFLSCSHWDGENGAAAQALRSGYTSCFKRCQALGASTVALPIIGPGLALGYPVKSAGRIFCQEVRTFGVSQPWAAEIQLVVHPSTPDLLGVFQDMQRDVESGRIQSQDGGDLYQPVHSTADSVQMRVGKYTVRITLGDILKETADAIVNPTNFKSWNKGSVAHVILSSVGSDVVDEVKTAQTPQGEILITGPGDLACQNIIHICVESNAKSIQQSVKKVLMKCEERHFTSVAFPAIGTGEGKMTPQASASAVLDAIASLAKGHSSSLAEIRLVILQKCFDAYKRELEGRLGPPADAGKTVVGVMKKCIQQIKKACVPKRPEVFESQKVPRPAAFDIFGTSKTDVETAKKEIEKSFEKNWMDKDLQDQQISNLQSLDVKTILGWANTSDVHVTIEKGLVNRIRLQGWERNVMEMLVDTQKLLKNLLQRSYEDIQQERTSLLVQWMYMSDEAYIPVDGMTNCLLETHYEQHGCGAGTGSGVKISLGGAEASVDFARMEATLRGTNKVARLKRADVGSGFDLPLDWDDMGGQLLTLVELKVGSKEYKGVQAKFCKTTSGLSIVKIQRIQNTYLERAYELKKKLITERNGPTEMNEKRLFHGTAPENCDSINRHGFNRRYDAANAKQYGDGVYFAVQASYSAQTNYSKADPQSGLRFMYQAKVVAGRYALGEKGMKVPPARPGGDPNDLYDSVVNNVANPAMYVVFHDDQAYPEYLITFQ